MIYVNLLIDYLICNLCGFNSYFIFIELDKRKILDVIICSLIICIFYGDILFCFVMLLIYFVFKLLKIKNKYIIIKNVLIILTYVFIREILHIFM